MSRRESDNQRKYNVRRGLSSDKDTACDGDVRHSDQCRGCCNTCHLKSTMLSKIEKFKL